MKRIINEKEVESLTPEEISYSKPRKVEFTLLDPTGIAIDGHEFYYRVPYGTRILLVVDGHPHYFGANGVYRGEPGGDSRPDVCYCGEKMKPMNDPNYICMNPFCDYYCKMRINIPKQKLPEGMPPESVCIDMDRDDVFVMQYHTLLHSKTQMTGDFLANTEKWLKENEDRYQKLTNKRP